MVLKTLISFILIVISYSGICQSGKLLIADEFEIDLDSDTITASRFIEDSIGNGYEIEYRYVQPSKEERHEEAKQLKEDHWHYISLVR